MSIKLMSMVFDSDLPTTEKMVLLAMADYASDNGDSIFPSIETLCHKTSLSDRSVQASIQKLIKKNYLILLKKGGGRANTNLYKIRCSRFAVFEKGESGSLKGETGAQKGERPSPDPSLTIIKTSLSAKADSDEPVYEPCDDCGELIPVKKPKKTPKSDGRSKTPAIIAFRRLTGQYPKVINYQEILDVLGENPNEPLLASCYREWCARGYNTKSIKWLTDWYKHGGIPGRNQPVPEPKGMAAVRAMAAELEARENGNR